MRGSTRLPGSFALRALVAGLLCCIAPQASGEMRGDPLCGRHAAQPMQAPDSSTRVLARLTDTGTPTSHCGIFHFKPVMRFELVEVRPGEPSLADHDPGDALYVAVSCPEMAPTSTPGFRFELDQVYELVIDRQGLRPGGIVIDAFVDQGGRRHELLWIDLPGAP